MCSSDLRQIEKTNGGARVVAENGLIQEFTGNEVVSMNLFGFKPSCYDFLGEEFRNFINEKGMDLKSELDIPTSLDKFVKNGSIKIKVLMSNERWFGVTYREDKPFVVDSIRKMIRDGKYPARIYD